MTISLSCLLVSGCFSKVQNSSIFRYFFSLFPKVEQNNNRKIIVFKDDDTANDIAIQRYRDACLHNGIVGSFAMVTDRITRNSIDVKKLIQFEQEGFTVMCHCNEHGDYWKSDSFDSKLQEEDISKAISIMKYSGFENFMYWQTPFGSYSNDIVSICKKSGLKALGTRMYGDCSINAFNHINKISRFNLVSYSMKHNDETGLQTLAKAKKLIDLFSSSNGGILILTTHFADWSELNWNTTIDSNGYPFGYERFNELAQYSLSSGCQIMNFSDAIDTMEPYFND